MNLPAQGITKEKGTMGKKKSGVLTAGRVFTLKNAWMKKNLDEATSLLERNHINLLEIFRRRDHQDREP